MEVMGRKVGPIGYGLMSLTAAIRPTLPSEEECFAALRASLMAGANVWNGGEFYGTPEHNSLTLLRKYYDKYPEDAEKVVLNVKGATRPGLVPDGSAAYIRESVETCLAMLGGKGKIDMFECARRDPNVPLEESIEALAELVKEGKIGGMALSEVSADTIRKAAKITKVVAVEIELSFFCTDAMHNGITTACAELNIPIMAYSPVGHGLLSGHIRDVADLHEKDFRRRFPIFQEEVMKNNLKVIDGVKKIAERKGCTPSQLAISWVANLSKRKDMPLIIPIPGTSKADRVELNSTLIELTAEDEKEIETLLATTVIPVDRFPAHVMKYVNG